MKAFKLVTHNGLTYAVMNRYAVAGDLIEITQLSQPLQNAGYHVGDIIEAVYVDGGFAMTDQFDIVPFDCYMVLVPTDQAREALGEESPQDVIDIVANLVERVHVLEQVVLALGQLHVNEDDLLGGVEIAQIIENKEGEAL